MIRIMLVDDHQMLMESLSVVLNREEDMEVVQMAKSKDEALTYLEDNFPQVDLALLDVRMSDGDTAGLDLADEINKYYEKIKILILTTYSYKGEYISRVFPKSIAGFLSKTDSSSEIIKAIRIVTSGPHKRYFPPAVTETMNEYIMKNREPLKELKLTPTEHKVLMLIWEGFSAREIATAMGIKQATVEVHVRNLHAKFEVKNRIQLIREAIRRGFINPDE